jgi:hypothetical protein
MSVNSPNRSKAVASPSGEPLTVDDLPPRDTRRWIARRKAEVVAAIRGGLISRHDACQRYNVSNAELFSWEELLDQHGLPGLRITQTQKYRRNSNDDPLAEPSS